MPVKTPLRCPQCGKRIDREEDVLGAVYQCYNLTCMWQGDDTEDLGSGLVSQLLADCEPVEFDRCGKALAANDRSCGRREHHNDQCRPPFRT